jgi:hypothetical protein
VPEAQAKAKRTAAPTITPAPTDTSTPEPTPEQTPEPTPTVGFLPVVEKETTPPPERAPNRGNEVPSPSAEADPPSSTPPPEKPAVLELSGLLFLGGIGSMALGCIYGLIHAVKKKKRSKKGSRRSRKARRSRR